MSIQLFSAVFGYGYNRENVGIGRITSYLRLRGIPVITTNLKNDNILEALQSVDFNLPCYGFSLYNTNAEIFINIMNHIKKVNPQSIIFVGSRFASIYYQDILMSPEFDAVDLVVLGDGEESIYEILECIDSGKDILKLAENNVHIASRISSSSKKPASLDINTLPIPDREWIKNNDYITALICDSHGCVGRCSFCTWANYHQKWNGRSPNDLYDEITHIRDDCGIRSFIFTSGSFEDPGMLGKQKIKELCNLLMQDNIPYSFQYFMRSETFTDNEEDRALLSLMKKAGFNIARVGIESGNEEDLRLYNKRASVIDNRNTLRMLREAGIYGGAYGFIMFNPYSNIERIQKNYEFLASNHAAAGITQYTTKLLLHKDTLIYDQIEKDGLLIDNCRFYEYNGLSYKYYNKEVEPIWQFVEEHFNNDLAREIDSVLDDIVTVIFGFDNILSKGSEYKEATNRILSEIEVVFRDYFYYLYKENNIKYCEDNYNTFMHKLKTIIEDLKDIKNQAIRSIFRETKAGNTMII